MHSSWSYYWVTGALAIYTAYIDIQCNARLICAKQKLLPSFKSPFVESLLDVGSTCT